MKKVGTVLVLFIATMMFSMGCGKKAADEIDFGAVKDSIYQNEYFGLTVGLPRDWSVLDQEARQRLMERGGKMVSGDDKNLKAALKASEMTTVNLFAAFKHPIDSPVSSNPSIMCVAERVREIPGIKKGADYLFHSKRVLESGQLQVAFPKEISTESIGGQEFDVMYMEMPYAGRTIQQKHYAAIMKGYALAFIVSFTTDEEEAALQNILKTAAFK